MATTAKNTAKPCWRNHYRKKDRLVLPLRLGDRFRPPGVPIHRIMSMKQQIWITRFDQPVGVRSVSLRRLRWCAMALCLIRPSGTFRRPQRQAEECGY